MEVSIISPMEKKAVRHYFEFFKQMHKLNSRQRRQVYYRLLCLHLITETEKVTIENIRRRITSEKEKK